MTTPNLPDLPMAVPLIERLRSVPDGQRLIIDAPDGMSTRCIPVAVWCHEAADAISTLSPKGAAGEAGIYLVATGEVVGGEETYTRHAGSPPPLCDFEGPLYATPQGAPQSNGAAQDSSNAELAQWQPIDTATPRDGSQIILGLPPSEEHPEGYASQGHWQEGWEDSVDDMGCNDGFVDCLHQFFSPPRRFGNPKYRSEGLQPTIWMRLPVPLSVGVET